jgi:di/tricarboxylate transporter
MAGLCLPVMVLSAFVNNTPIVAALVPLVLEWAETLRISPSKLLMPLSFSCACRLITPAPLRCSSVPLAQLLTVS